jgi:iron-sulfur cluster assembly protein
MAAEKIKEVLVEEDANQSSLRVIAVPNDNGSVQYMLTLEQESQPDDTPVTLDGLKFLVDSESAPYLEKATIDFVEDLTRAGFIISNPDFPAQSGCGSGGGGCGCGSGGGGGGCGSGSGGGGCGCGS